MAWGREQRAEGSGQSAEGMAHGERKMDRGSS